MRRLASIFLFLLWASAARAEGLPEAWKGFFYRAPGNTASVHLASLNPTIWSWSLSDWKGARVLSLFQGTAKSFKAKGSLIFYPTAAKKVDPVAVAKGLMEKTKKGAPYLMELAPARAFDLRDLRGASGMLAGDDEAGVRVHVVVTVYADGKESVATLFQASEKEMQRDTAVIMKSVVDTIRVGKSVRVPLVAKAPATPLVGLYEGPGHKLLLFDEKGYVSRIWPLFDLEYDLELLSQDRPEEVGTYTRDGDALAWTIDGKKTSAKLDKGAVVVGDERYVRIDDQSEAVSLAGRWQSDEHVLDFTSGGAATLDGAPAAWRIEGAKLIIDYNSGVSDWRPIYPHVGPDGKVATDVVHIGPRTYLRVSK